MNLFQDSKPTPEARPASVEDAELAAEGVAYPVTREIVGDTSLYALAASVLVARKLGVSEEAVRKLLAP